MSWGCGQQELCWAFFAAIRCKFGAEANAQNLQRLYAAIRQPLSISNTIKQPFDKLRVTGISSLTNLVLSG